MLCSPLLWHQSNPYCILTDACIFFPLPFSSFRFLQFLLSPSSFLSSCRACKCFHWMNPCNSHPQISTSPSLLNQSLLLSINRWISFVLPKLDQHEHPKRYKCEQQYDCEYEHVYEYWYHHVQEYGLAVNMALHLGEQSTLKLAVDAVPEQVRPRPSRILRFLIFGLHWRLSLHFLWKLSFGLLLVLCNHLFPSLIFFDCVDSYEY